MTETDDVWGRAVEAAAEAFHRTLVPSPRPWVKIREDLREHDRATARAVLAAALPVLLADLADRIEDEGRDDVEFLTGDKTPSGLGRTVGAEDAYKAAIRVVRSFASEVSRG